MGHPEQSGSMEQVPSCPLVGNHRQGMALPGAGGRINDIGHGAFPTEDFQRAKLDWISRRRPGGMGNNHLGDPAAPSPR